MKIKITYEYDTAYGVLAPCWAKTFIDSRVILANGKTYELAKESLIERVKMYCNPKSPPPAEEDIEIEV